MFDFNNNDLYAFCLIECKNSGRYTDSDCTQWMSLGDCHSDEWQDDMFEHCQETCGFCNSGKYQKYCK